VIVLLAIFLAAMAGSVAGVLLLTYFGTHRIGKVVNNGTHRKQRK